LHASALGPQKVEGTDGDEHHGGQRRGNSQGDQRAPEKSHQLVFIRASRAKMDILPRAPTLR
jgi:hypothetical protein